VSHSTQSTETTVLSAQPAEKKPRILAVFRRFRHNNDGATAVEFGLVATPFFMLMMAIFELAMLFQSSRVILTGEAMTLYPNPATAVAAFKSDVCTRLTLVSNCNTRLSVDVRTYTSFATATANQPVSGGVLDTSGFGYQPILPNQIAVVRAVLSYPIVLSSWNKVFSDLANGERALMATLAFRAEPFCPPPGTSC
jgi:Flp pilus assembly protein TadG